MIFFISDIDLKKYIYPYDIIYSLIFLIINLCKRLSIPVPNIVKEVFEDLLPSVVACGV